MLLWTLRIIYCIYAFVVFIFLMVIVFIFGLFTLPFGRVRGGNLLYQGCKSWADTWLFLIFIRHKNLYEAPHDESHSYIYVSNHISYLDAALIPKIFRKPVRPLGKVELAKVPLFGFIYRRVIVTVDRSSAANRANSVRLLKSILKKGISVLVFPEGTFNMTHQPLKDFYDGAFRIAIETNTPVKPVLIMNAYDLMHYRSVFCLRPGRSEAIFLREFSTADYKLEDVALLKRQVFEEMEKKLIEYGAGWIQMGEVDKVDKVDRVDNDN